MTCKLIATNVLHNKLQNEEKGPKNDNNDDDDDVADVADVGDKQHSRCQVT